MSELSTSWRSPWRVMILYVGLSFAISWSVWIGCWFASRHGTSGTALMPAVIAGSFAPFLASGLAVWRGGGAKAALSFYLRGLDLRMGWFVFAVSVLLLPLLALGTAATFAALAGRTFHLQMAWSELPVAYVWLLILGGPLAEEFGWSYLSDRLDEKFPSIFSTLLLGSIWALWHLPLFFLVVPGLDQTFIPFPAFLAFAVGCRFLFSWAYHHGRRNILSNLLMHNGMNLALSLAPIVSPTHGDPQWPYLAFGVAAAVSAAALYKFAPPPGEQTRHPTGMLSRA
jgi:hypothetical protein